MDGGLNTLDQDILPAHSDLGASGMDRWSHCAASFALSQKERHRLPTVHAATGTVAHNLVEQTTLTALARGDADRALNKYHGLVIKVDGHDVLIDETMTDGVLVMLKYLLSRSNALGVEPMVEKTVFVDDYFPNTEPPPVRMFGRSDAWFYTPKLLEVVDYKNGSGVFVDVVDHPQLLYYAAGVLKWLELMDEDIPDYVKLTVVQPNARTPEKIRSYDLTALDVIMWVHDTMIPAVRACEDPGAKYTPGKWCQFCPVAHACPELLANAQLAAKLQFDDSAEADVIADRLEIAERAQLWAEAVRGLALERIQGGLVVPGWGSVPTRPRRVWTDPDAIGKLLTANNVEPFEHKLRSPAQVEKIVRNTSSTWALVKPYIESKSGGTKLSRVSSGVPDEDNDNLFDLIDA